jgi:hypothetical protein
MSLACFTPPDPRASKSPTKTAVYPNLKSAFFNPQSAISLFQKRRLAHFSKPFGFPAPNQEIPMTQKPETSPSSRAPPALPLLTRPPDQPGQQTTRHRTTKRPTACGQPACSQPFRSNQRTLKGHSRPQNPMFSEHRASHCPFDSSREAQSRRRAARNPRQSRTTTAHSRLPTVRSNVKTCKKPFPEAPQVHHAAPNPPVAKCL